MKGLFLKKPWCCVDGEVKETRKFGIKRVVKSEIAVKRLRSWGLFFFLISGATIPFISSQRRDSKPSNFAVILVFLTFI